MVKIPRTALEHIWDLPENHVPAVHDSWWESVIPGEFRAEAIRCSSLPVPIGEFRDISNTVIPHLKPLDQLLLLGEALLCAVFDPALHFSLVNKSLIYASGVTVLLVEARRDGEICVCPWSMGEKRHEVLRRLIKIRKAPSPRLTSRESFIAANMIPRAQACISVVSQLGIKQPQTNILASGGECPISVTLGTRYLHFVLDHRVYDSIEAGLLYERFFNFLDEIYYEQSHRRRRK